MEDFFKQFETPNWLKQSDAEVNFKLKMRKRKLFPIIKDDVIYVYKILSTSETKRIIRDCSDNLCSSHYIVTNDEKIKNDFYFRSSYSRFFKNLLSYHVSTKEELYRYYRLDDVENRNSFLELPQNQIFKANEYMEFDKLVEAMSSFYLTFVFKEPSKISAIISFLSGYLDIDYAASEIYYLLNSKSKSFFKGSSPIEDEQMELDRIRFTTNEMSLSDEEKISLIKDVFDSFNVECVYSSKIDEMNDFMMSSIFGTKSKNLVLGFAQHNYDLIYNSEFSSIYKRVMSSKTKSIVKE